MLQRTRRKKMDNAGVTWAQDSEQGKTLAGYRQTGSEYQCSFTCLFRKLEIQFAAFSTTSLECQKHRKRVLRNRDATLLWRINICIIIHHLAQWIKQ
jgi:hypothetical protein